MTHADDDQREEVLARLMAEYDDALVAHAPVRVVDESVVDRDPQLMLEWDEAKRCIDLLDRARRHAALRDSAAPGTLHQDLRVVESGPDVAKMHRLGRFEIKRELGRGGLGIVFLAHDPKLRRDVALKVPRFEALLDDGARRRFLRESEAAARLSHPHLVTLLEVGHDGPICYLISEFCPGPTLADWLRAYGKQVPVNQAAALVLDLARAIEHAHSRGVLHRDIKPSNVLLEPRAGRSETDAAHSLSNFSPKLADFGMAKLLEGTSGETRTGAMIGTLAYMSPEQVEGRADEFDARMDIYALGVVLYELVSGTVPYSGKSDADTMRQLVTSEPAPPRRVRRDLPRDLEAITLKCLARRPADRYATAHELALDLKRFLSGAPTAARPLGVWERTCKWARKRPALAALLAVCVVAAIGLIGMATVYNARLQSALGRADDYNSQLQSALSDARELLYTADMKLGFDAWHGDNAGALDEHLARFQPVAGQPDLRTFPWHFLSRQRSGNQTDLDFHAGTVYAVAWSPRGDLIAAGGAGGEIRLWDVSAGRTRRILKEHRGDVNDLAFSPDGRWLVSCGDDFVVRVWDVDAPQPARILKTGTSSDLNGLAFSPDGRWLAVGGEDQRTRVWNTATWKLANVLTAGASAVNRVAFSPESRRIVISQSNGLGTVFDVETAEALATLEPRQDPRLRMGAVAYSPDGRFVATASIELQQINFWDPDTGTLLKSWRSEGNWIHAMTFSPDSRWLITGHQDGAVRIWDVETLECLHALLGHSDDVRDLAISPHGDQLVSSGADRTLKLWDLAAVNHRQTREELPGLVTSVVFHPKQNVFAVGEQWGPVRLIDAGSREVQFESDVPRGDTGWELAFSSGGEYLAYSIRNGKSIEVLDVAARKPLAQLDAANASFSSIAFLRHSNRIATGDDRSVFTVWDATSAAKLRECRTGQGAINAIALFSNDEQVVIAAHEDIRVWDLKTLERGVLLDGASKKVFNLAVSPDQRWLAGSGSNGDVFLWDLTTRKLRTLLVGHRGWSRTLSFSPDGTTLASAGDDGTVRLWDLRTFQEIGVMLTGTRETRQMISVAFSPDGQTLIAGGRGSLDKGGLYIWSLGQRSKSPP